VVAPLSPKLPDGSAPSAGGYRLYVNLATPAGQVAATVRHLRGLQDALPMTTVTRMGDGKTELPDGLQAVLLSEASGRALGMQDDLIPAVLDEMFSPLAQNPQRVTQSMVDRESAGAMQEQFLGAVQRAGAASTQAEYEAACADYFRGLEALDEVLKDRRFIGGDERPGLSDLWFFSVLIRHDPAFHIFYKMALKRLSDFEHLEDYARDLFQRPGWSDYVQLPHIRQHYAWLDENLNPKQRVPTGGLPDLWRPHDRHERFGTQPPSDAGTEESQSQASLPGTWVRKTSAHRARISAEPGSPHPVEANRYHLYVSHNCPWSHRASLVRGLLGLEEAVGRDVTYYRRDPERGWQFNPTEPGCTPDTLFGSKFITDIYEREQSTERSVPILFDKVAGKIVSNESADIVRMFGTELRELGTRPLDLYPEAHRPRIDQLNTWIYHRINNGAYKAGFSSAQAAHDEAADALFDALDSLDQILSDKKFLCGDEVTEADLRLFPTVFRFDHVYYTRFLLNRKRINDYEHLSRWRRDFFLLPGVNEASNLDQCKKGYFGRTGNGFVPVGPVISFTR